MIWLVALLFVANLLLLGSVHERLRGLQEQLAQRAAFEGRRHAELLTMLPEKHEPAVVSGIGQSVVRGRHISFEAAVRAADERERKLNG